MSAPIPPIPPIQQPLPYPEVELVGTATLDSGVAQADPGATAGEVPGDAAGDIAVVVAAAPAVVAVVAWEGDAMAGKSLGDSRRGVTAGDETGVDGVPAEWGVVCGQDGERWDVSMLCWADAPVALCCLTGAEFLRAPLLPGERRLRVRRALPPRERRRLSTAFSVDVTCVCVCLAVLQG